MYKAIIQERAFEFGGEGDRRYTLIRIGLVAEAIPTARAANQAMVDGLNATGGYTFPKKEKSNSLYFL